MHIEFIQSHKAYLPELTAYSQYFQSKGHSFVINDYPSDSHADLLWYFMGLNRFASNIPVIHEYGSLSLAPFAYIKDTVKKHYNLHPSGRIFLNQYIKNRLDFNDSVPHLLRDMGVAQNFFQARVVEKKFDYVYMGAISRARTIDKLCWHFQKIMKGSSLLLIGEPEKAILHSFGNVANITFVGRLPYADVPVLAAQAVYGINVTPNIYPYNQQTSTKLLEYCALGLDVVTTKCSWVEAFCQKRNGKFFFLDETLSNLTKKNIEQFDFVTPSIADLEWNFLLEDVNLNNWVMRLTR